MRIGIIGSGRVGRALARGWSDAGHEVAFGSRAPEATAAKLEGQLAPVRLLSPAEAAAFGPVVVLATPFGALGELLPGLPGLKNTVLVDATNPLGPDGSLQLPEGAASGGQQVAAWAPGARVVKCFNTTGSANLGNPIYGNDALTMCLCGDDPEAKGLVARLAADLGFDPVDVGGLEACALLEAAAQLWIRLAYRQGLGPSIGWKLLRK